MIKRTTLSFEELAAQGRGFLDSSDATRTHSAFNNWVENVATWLDDNHPGTGASAEWGSLKESPLVRGGYYFEDPQVWDAFRDSVRQRLAWLARFAKSDGKKAAISKRAAATPSLRVFVVHGRDEAARESVARFISKLKLEPVILHEQPDKGRTIVEKFTDYADVSFAVVLLTGDDVGGLKGTDPSAFKSGARQNVVLELGYFLGRLGRDRVCALYEDGTDIPSDYHGVLFVPLSDWRLKLARELSAAGLPVDMNGAV